MDTLLLPDELARAILEHARACYPEEACGLVIGREGSATAIYPARNVARDKASSYEVDFDTLAKQVDLDEQGQELLAIYHSHPRGPALPSSTDRKLAEYDVVYIICSLEDPAAPALKGFRLREATMSEVGLRQGLDT